MAIVRRNDSSRCATALTQVKNGLFYGALMAKTHNCGGRQTWCTCASGGGDQQERRALGTRLSKPFTPLLDHITSPADLRKLSESDLAQLADELRAETISAVSVTGGHLGAGLGVVELTVALHYVFDTPTDRIVWDVGHQAYPHKILTAAAIGSELYGRAEA